MIRKLNYSRRGNILQVRASDPDGNLFYNKVINLNSKREIEELKSDLIAKGCNFPIRWLE